MRQFDKLWVGIIIGLLFPLLFGYIFITTNYHGEMSPKALIAAMTTSSMIVKFIFIAILPNMFAVFLFNSFEFWRICRGLFVAIWIYLMIAVPFLA